MEETSREGSGKEDMSEIYSLTAEIESFVRTADTDKEKLRDSPEKLSNPIKSASTTITTTAIVTSSPDRITQQQVQPKPTIKPKSIKQDATTSTTSSKSTTTTTAIIETTTNRQVVDNHKISPEKKTNTESRVIEIQTIHTAPKEQSPEIVSLPSSTRASPENNEEYQTPEREIYPVATSTPSKSLQKSSSEKQLNITTTTSAKSRSIPPKIFIREATEDDDFLLEQQPLPPPPNHTVTTPRSTEVEFILEEQQQHEIVRTFQTPKPQSIDELKITESSEDLEKSTLPNTSTTTTTTTTKSTTETDADSFRVRFVPLKNFTPEPIRRDIHQAPTNKYLSKTNGTATTVNGCEQNGITQKNCIPPQTMYDDDNNVVVIVQKKVPPAPPQRRRSVRDIIASINKSQSLLKINQDAVVTEKQQYTSLEKIPQYAGQPLAFVNQSKPLQQVQTTPSNESIVRNINELQDSDKQIKQMILEMERAGNDDLDVDVQDIPVPVEKFNEFNKDEMFKKCVIRRDKSSMDWNPLPKPRRSRNLTHEAEIGKL